MFRKNTNLIGHSLISIIYPSQITITFDVFLIFLRIIPINGVIFQI